tara:strand:+ start:1219 stop:2730 length:1512 start_codon:yes stop_codon:yes gene_type:complete
VSNYWKPILGIAAIVFAPVLAPALLGGIGVAATAGAVAVASAGIVLVGASLVGSSTGDAMGSAIDQVSVEGYSGAKLQTTKSNTSPVPIIYGEHKIGGNIIWQHTGAHKNSNNTTNGYNRDYWAIMILADHEINSLQNVFSGETTMTGTSNQGFETEYVHVRYNAFSTSARNVQNNIWIHDTNGSTASGNDSDLGFSSAVIPANVAFLAVHQVFDGENTKNTALEAITVKVQGKKIRTITNATTISSSLTYSTNPAEILLDLLGTGLGVADADIDIATFYAAKTAATAAGFTCHLALIQQANIQSIIADVLATCRGKIFHSESKWKFRIDTKSQSVVDTLTSDDVMGNSLSMSMAGSNNIANKMILKYINPADEYLSAQVVKEDSTLQTYDGRVVTKTLDIKGVNNATHANKLCEIALNSLRYSEDASGNRVKQTPLAISFATSVKNAHLEVGDVISLNHTLLDRVRQFLILATATDQSGVIQISAREYCETHFKNASASYLI